MKRVLIITNEPSPYMDIWFYALRKKFEVIVLYASKAHPLHPWESSNYFPGELLSEVSIFKQYRAIKNSDFVLVCGWYKPRFFLSLLFAFIQGKTVAMYTDHLFHSNKYADFFKKTFLYRHLNYVFCATKATCCLLSSRFDTVVANKLRLFPYGINTNVEMQPFSGGHDLYLLVATNFYERKGHSVLFNALELLNKEDNRHRYHIKLVGTGPDVELYKKRAEGLDIDIQFYGWVESDVYNNLLNQSDVYIHPSIEEPFGIPPVDAMCRGKVVIACDGVMSVNGFIRQGINGYHYPTPIETPEAFHILYEILRDLDKKDFSSIGQQARKDAIEFFDIDKYVSMVHELLE